MAANKPSGAARGGLRMPGWRALVLLWVALGAAIGSMVIWAELNASRPLTTAEAPAEPAHRPRDRTIFTAAIPPEVRSGDTPPVATPPADPTPAAGAPLGIPPANGSATADPAAGTPPATGTTTAEPAPGAPPANGSATADPAAGTPPATGTTTADPAPGAPPATGTTTADPAPGAPPAPGSATADPAPSAPPAPGSATADPAPRPSKPPPRAVAVTTPEPPAAATQPAPSAPVTPPPAVAVAPPPPVSRNGSTAVPPVAGAAVAAPVTPPPSPATPTQMAAVVQPVPPRPPPAAQAPTAAVVRPPAPSASGMAEPDPALLEPSSHGMLPRRGPDGRLPYMVYAQPYRRADTRSRIGLIVADSGAYGAYSEDALRRLPSQVAIAISPYAPHAETMAARARERGMETLVALPLEPAGFPLNDPGQRALLTIRSPAENADNLDWVLSRFPGYVGVIGALGPMRGERFANLPENLRRVHDTLRERGLLYIDPRPGTPTTDRVWGRTIDIVLDEPPMRNEIERRLSEIDTIARLRGSALGYAGTLSPTLLDRLVAWAAGLEARGLTLVPVSSMLRVRQPAEPEPPVPVNR